MGYFRHDFHFHTCPDCHLTWGHDGDEMQHGSHDDFVAGHACKRCGTPEVSLRTDEHGKFLHCLTRAERKDYMERHGLL